MKKIIYIILLVLCFGLSAQGPEVQYIFSNNTSDFSGNNISGSLPNGGTYVADRFGIASSALDLDGNTQYVSVNNGNQPLITGNEITFSGWYKLREYRADAFVISTPGIIAFFDENGFTNFAPQDAVLSNILTYSTAVPLDTWFHFVGTYDGSITRIYIDGAEVASQQIDKTMNLAAFGTQVGGNGTQNFPGSIDDIRIYDRALSASEILDIYSTVAHYTFSGDATDQSGNGHDGTVNGATLTIDRFGEGNSAYLFDGTDDYITSSLNLTTNQPFSISTWVNWDGGTGIPKEIVSWLTGSIAGGTRAYLGVAETGQIRFGDTYVPNLFLTPQQWVHLTATYDGDVSRIYINGELEETSGTGRQYDFTGANLFIGRQGTNDDEYWDGKIDDIQIYNRALSDAEVSALHSSESTLAASYTFSGDATDESGNGNDGTVVGATLTTDRFGNANSAFDFDGIDDRIDVAHSESLSPTEQITISMWVKADDIQTNQFSRIYNKENSPERQLLSFQGNGSILAFGLAIDGVYQELDVSINPIAFEDNWNHVVATYDGTAMRLYRNSRQIGSLSASGSIGTNTVNVSIGSVSNGGENFNGQLDDIRVYRSALSVTEIEELYESQTGLVAEYTFDGNANDESGNGHHGTVTGAILRADRFGNANSAYQFNGIGNVITVPHSTELELTDEFTITAWVLSETGQGTDNTILFKGNSTADHRYHFYLSGGDNRLRGSVGATVNLTQNPSLGSSSEEWIFVVLRYKGGQLEAYQNSLLFGTATVDFSTVAANTSNLLIGEVLGAPNQFFEGAIDDIRIYNRSLSTLEMLLLYNENNWLSPKITTVYPQNGAPGEVIRVNGRYLAASGTTINMGGQEVTPFSFQSDGLLFNVPDVEPGNQTFTISSFFGESFEQQFTVLRTKTSPLSFINDQSISAAIPVPFDIQLADFNEDNYPDLLTYSYDDGDLLIFHNDQTGGFPSSTLLFDGPASQSQITTIESADLNSDGKLDIVMFDASTIHWFQNLGSESYSLQNTVATGSNFRDLAVGDMDSDGVVDVVVVENGVIQWYRNDGFGSFGTAQVMSSTPSANLIALVDWDYDGDMDLVEAGGSNFYLRNDGGSFFQILLNTPTNGSDAVTIVDLDNDDFPDMVTGSFNDHDVGVYLNDQAGSLSTLTDINFDDTYLSPIDFGVGDMEGDGDQDLLAAFFNGGGIALLYQNDDGGNYSTSEVTTGQTGISRIEPADLDNDGDLDIVYSRQDGNIRWLENANTDTYQVVAQLGFDGNLNDDSGFGNDGTLTTGSLDFVENRFGDANQAIDLLAGQGINIGNNAELNLGIEFTLNMWLNPVDNNNGGGIFESSGSFHQHIYSTGFDWRYFQGTTEFAIDGIPVVAPNGVWTMFTWSYDGTNMRFYENGELKHTEAVLGDIDVNSNSYFIASGFDGSIDDFMWVDGVLSHDQIRALFNDGLVAEYTFDGDALDQTTNGNDGMAIGATLTTDRFGNDDSAYLFDGDDYIEVADDNSLDFATSDFSISAWIQTSDAVNLQRIVSKGSSSGSDGYMIRTTDSGTVLFEMNGTALATTSTVVADGNWHLVTAVLDRDLGARIIVDDQLDAEQTVNTIGVDPTNNTPLTIGVHNVNSEPFFGKIDDVRIFDRIVSEAEASQIYHENEWDIADFKSFSFLLQTGPATIDAGTKTIEIEVSYGATQGSLTPNFSLSTGATAKVNGVSQTSGVTSNDYSNPVIYTVTGLDGTTMASWVVKVTEDDLLEAYYPFNGNANDWGEGGFDGTLQNGPTLIPDRFGNDDSAFSFDGVDDFITTDFDPADNGPFTLSFWSYWDAPNVGFKEMIGFTDDAETAPVYFGTASDNTIRAIGSTGVLMPDQQWTHLVFRHDGNSTLDLFLDGQLVLSSTSFGVFSFGPMAIGAFSRNGGENWNGDLDDIRFYSRAISNDEVLDLLYEGGWIPEINGIVAEYEFKGNADDTSGNGFHGVPDAAPADPDLTNDRFGDIESAYYFDGDDVIRYSNTANYDFGDEMSVVAWINSSAYSATEPEFLANSSFDFKLSTGTSNDAIFKTLKAEVFGSGFVATGELALDTWYHVAFTYERNNEIIVYLDGEAIGSSTAANLAIAPSASQLISGAGGMDGVIDDLTIYDDVLSPESIQELYLSTGNLLDEAEILSFNVSSGGLISPSEYNFIGELNESWYYQSLTSLSWDDAKAAAEALGGHLAVINSLEENSLISAGLTESAWLGASDVEIEGTFQWVNGSPFNFENWGSTEPNGGTSENHLQINPAGDWNDLAGSTPLSYVVEIPFYDGSINYDNNTVTIDAPYGTDVSSLIATFTLSDGARAYIEDTHQESGITVNDFTDPVLYTVFAQDLSTQDWVIDVNVGDGLAVYFPFNGNANDESGNGHYGIVSGATLVSDRFNAGQSAYDFNGTSDEIYFTDVDLVGGTNSVSLSYWINIDDVTRFNEIVNFGGLSFRSYTQTNGSVTTQVFIGGTGFTIGTPSINPDRWYHVVFTYDNVNFRMYLDGSMVAEAAHSGPIDFNNSFENYIGSANGSNYTDGTIDDIRLFNRSLASTEILALYNEGGWPINLAATDFTSFTVPEQAGPTTIDVTNHTIDLEVVFGTNRSSLVPSFTLSTGATASIGGTSQVSGSTANNFSAPVTYTVTAQDGSTNQDWVVTITETSNTSTDILTYSFAEQAGPANIDDTNHIVEIPVTQSVDVTSLVANFTLSSGATARVNGISQVSGVTVNNFTSIVTYTITALDGSTTQDWDVTVFVSSNSFPTDINISSNTIAEDEPTGTVVGIFSTSDVDGSDTHIYSLVSGTGDTDNGSFSISGNELRSEEVFDYETQSSYIIRVQTDDQNGGTFEKSFDILITDVEEGRETTFFNLVTPRTYTLGDGGLTVGADITDPDGLSSVAIYFKKVGADSYTDANMTNTTGDTYSFNIGDASIDNTGVQYYFQVVDGASNVTSSNVFLTSIVVADDEETLTNVASGTTIQAYRIVSFPYQSFSSSLLTDDLGNYNTNDWRLIRYFNGGYQDLSQFNTIAPGVGYWFIMREQATISIGGQSVEVDNNGIFFINLVSGYNLIGNPFKGTLNWQQVVDHNITLNIIQSSDIASGNSTTLDGWNGSWTDRSSLSPFEGGFVNMVNAVNNFQIPISAIGSTGGRSEAEIRAPQDVLIDELEWDFRFYFSTPSYSYSMGGIGMHPNALDTDGPFDKGLLPKFFLYLDQQFEDGNTRSVKQTDFYKSWSFTLPNNLEEDFFNLTWDIPVSGSKTIILVDGVSKRLYDLKKVSNIRLSNDPSAVHYVFFGEEEMIYERMDLPFEVLAQIYPNPVENELTLQMYSPTDKIATLELISVDGKKALKEFVHLHRGMSQQKIKLDGKSIGNGLYFLKVDNKVLTKILKK